MSDFASAGTVWARLKRIMREARIEPSAACALLAVAGMAAYSNSFYAPFVWDGRNLERRLRPLQWADPLAWFDPIPRSFGFFTFDLQYTLHGGWLPGFHAVNIAIHVIASIALFWVVLLTCRRATCQPGIRADAVGLALASALLFELHPLQTQSVTYLYQRFESLMGMFFLVALLCFVLATGERPMPAPRRLALLFAAWAAVLLSIGSKEVGVAAPLVMLWYDRAFVADSWRTLISQRWWFYLPFALVMGLAVVFLYAYREHYASGGIFDTDRMPPLVYAAHQPYVICRYLQLVFWPRGQCLDWALKRITDSERLVPPLLGILVAFGFTGWSAVRLPAIGFLVGAFFLILAPTSSFAPIIDLAFEHRMYLPLAPLSVLLVLCGREGFRRYGAGHSAAAAAVACIALALGVTTFLRNEVYGSGIRLWIDVIEKSPLNARAFTNLAWHVEMETDDVDAAIRLNQRALELNPRLAYAHRGLAVLLFPRNQRQSLWHAREAVRLEPTNAENHNNLGIVLAEIDAEEAEKCFREAIRLDERLREARVNLARLESLRKQAAAAERR